MADFRQAQRRAQTGPSVLVPNMLSSCVLWLDASRLSSLTYDGSNRVSQWADLSGQANHVTQATDGNKPVRTVGVVNELQALLLDDSTSQYLEIDEAVVTEPPFTVLVVAQSDTATINQVPFAVANSGSSSEMWVSYWGGGNAGDPLIWLAFGAAGSASTASGYSVNTPTLGTFLEESSSSRTAWINGGDADTDSSTKAPSGVNRTSIGRAGDLTPSTYFSGYICEIAVFNEALSDVKRQKLEQYLADKWGVTLS